MTERYERHRMSSDPSYKVYWRCHARVLPRDTIRIAQHACVGGYLAFCRLQSTGVTRLQNPKRTKSFFAGGHETPFLCGQLRGGASLTERYERHRMSSDPSYKVYWRCHARVLPRDTIRIAQHSCVGGYLAFCRLQLAGVTRLQNPERTKSFFAGGRKNTIPLRPAGLRGREIH